jgi:hypothetical protein
MKLFGISFRFRCNIILKPNFRGIIDPTILPTFEAVILANTKPTIARKGTLAGGIENRMYRIVLSFAAYICEKSQLSCFFFKISLSYWISGPALVALVHHKPSNQNWWDVSGRHFYHHLVKKIVLRIVLLLLLVCGRSKFQATFFLHFITQRNFMLKKDQKVTTYVSRKHCK